ncbi:MAG: DUF1553 domain-containing protein [Planctomycetaceae bacterium]
MTVEAQAQTATNTRLDFARDVRPILSNHCWSCHGQDEATRQGKLRLDRRDTAIAKSESDKIAVTPGQPAASELIARINTRDDDLVMPPPSAKKPLTVAQKETLRRWIEQGADFAQHWAFVTPQRPAVPRTTSQISNPIDAFVLARLESERLAPSPSAPKETLIRRVTLDLTGLPPSLNEVRDFLADDSPDAFEKVVDRLLVSPRHAERMAMNWLDAARYADTNGYNNDESRSMWPWRDWVIEAFASAMPYDQFLTEQLAGDLLPNATLAQRVATGFNRNHVLTTEGGIIEEEYHVEYVADRVHTTATTIMGLSFQCARCHDHKFDPLTQREYYQFAAFFNNVPDRVVGYSSGRMAEPVIKVPSRAQQAELDRLQRRKTELEASLKQRETTIDDEVARWEKSLTPDEIAKAGPAGLVSHFPFDEPDGEHVGDAANPARRGTIRGKVARVPGKLSGALNFDGNTFVDAGDVGTFDSDEKFSFATWIRPTSNAPTTILSKNDEANAFRGYDIILEGAKVCGHFSHHWPDKAFKVVAKQPLSLNEWHHIVVTYDGSRRATGVKIYVDGKPQPHDATTNNLLDGTLKTDKPFHIGKRSSSVPFQGQIDDVQVYSVELTADEAASLAAGQTLGRLKDILAVAPAERSESQKTALRQFYLDRIDVESRKMKSQLADLPRLLAELNKAIPVTMVMQEQMPRRSMFLLRRGQYDQRGDEVTSGVPSVFSSLPKDVPADRATLARWLTSPSHPLTARVAVNRWWEMLLGTGLVETAEDFGVQGTLPSHPELLDWLATELIRTGWDQRAMLKLIVTSATYRQSSGVASDLLERDPRNRLLARGPRYRLPAETVRDNALAISGLLRERLGGPSVKPYQPDGLWEDVSVERRDKYVADAGDGAYRRGMYTFWKRTCPPPGMTTFDAPDREFCLIRRARTNTPLQALVLLNDPTFVEAARVLAERVLIQETDDVARITLAFEITLSRRPTEKEVEVLSTLLHEARQRFQSHRSDADKLLAVGQPRTVRGPVEELAAWTTVANLLLNLDEAISKN